MFSVILASRAASAGWMANALPGDGKPGSSSLPGFTKPRSSAIVAMIARISA